METTTGGLPYKRLYIEAVRKFCQDEFQESFYGYKPSSTVEFMLIKNAGIMPMSALGDNKSRRYLT
ncbi:hypothetical protein QUA81_29295 [Microcoleus sp. F6_B4]